MKLNVNTIVRLPLHDSGYTHCIARLSNAYVGRSPQKYRRRKVLYIKNIENGRWILRYVMGAGGLPGLTKDAVALDYDGIEALGANRKECSLEIKPATFFQRQIWLCNHPDLVVSTSFRLCWIGLLLTVEAIFDRVLALL
ncbi:hypothetical protein VTH8203_01522 [Vibrio thalassae]|uniref:Uncharacterized protein n=1 Tax=Vibrio thalassae TaxID=1243014 RepID=A0A240EGU8_9VIBR|nr:hypothetical protein [Vibrio thalassae]SNX47907.1 hypothetical protein VTH8203_01522 [Vibrio thalassae]